MSSASKKGGVPAWVWIVIALVVVLPVAGALCLVLVFGVAGFMTYRRASEAIDESSRTRAEIVATAVELYRTERATCPTLQDLRNTSAIAYSDGLDAQGREWMIACEMGGAITVRSAGMDGISGNNDDVVVTR